MSGQPSLTDEQREAVEAPDGAYYVLAPPGSGKTEVLVRRALWLVEQSAHELFRVLAIAYTSKGAEELRERAAQRLGEDAWRVDATSFHAFCLLMLDRYGEAVGVTSGVGVYDTDDLRLEVLAEALRGDARALDEVDRDEVLSLLRRIDEMRMELMPPELAPDTPVLDGDITMAEAYELYELPARAIAFAPYWLSPTPWPQPLPSIRMSGSRAYVVAVRSALRGAGERGASRWGRPPRGPGHVQTPSRIVVGQRRTRIVVGQRMTVRRGIGRSTMDGVSKYDGD